MSTKVPFVDLSRIHKVHRQELMEKIASIVDRSAFVLGKDVEDFEKDFAKFLGSPQCVGVNSGLDALKIALQSLHIGPGDEVITSANTFIATAFAISAAGAKPVLVDVDPQSFNIDPHQVEKHITAKTKAIIPVHLYGQAADIAPLLKIAKKHKLKVIEDAAQAHGAKYHGNSCGTMGDVGCFSFYPSKNLGALGEGGALVSADESVIQRAKVLRNVGQREKYEHEMIGHNSRLHSLQAAVLQVKLQYLAQENSDRGRAAERYRKALSGVKEITLPKELADRTHIYHLYVITTRSNAEREGLRKHLQDEGIQTGIHYPIPIHLQKCYQTLGHKKGSFPVTERLAETILSLPIFPGMEDAEITTAAGAIKKFFLALRRNKAA